MTRPLRIVGWTALVALVVGVVGLLAFSRDQAITLITSPRDTRRPLERTPADLGLPYVDVRVMSADGLSLAGWHVPSMNGATVMLQHGYKVNRGWRTLDIAAILQRHGYGVLLTSVRAHDLSDGELITFGRYEMADLKAWHDYLQDAPETRDRPLGFLGNSMGGSLAIQFAALTPAVRAVVAHSAFSSLLDTVDTSIRSFTGLPPFPFAPLIRFWVEREWGFDASVVDFTDWIDDIGPRPVLLMQGGADRRISPNSGQLLFDAAHDPRDLWFEPSLGHAVFHIERPEEFEHRVIEFFDEHLLELDAEDSR